MKSIIAAVLAAVAVTATASAQDGSKSDPTAAAMSDFIHLSGMMGQQQMRHIKLWFAGDAGNWPLADYEIDGLKQGFEDIARLLGDDIAQEHVGAAVSALEKAVDGKDHDAFVVAFDRLSAACNACHQTLDHAFIVIQRPAVLPYGDQNFSLQR
jgi:cytochrome c556